MTLVALGPTPTLVASANTPVQFYIQNQGAGACFILAENGSNGTELQIGDTLIMGFQDPLVPQVKVFGRTGSGAGLVDIEQWPF
jgi:hypothetical protein